MPRSIVPAPGPAPAELAWERLRAAIERRFCSPGDESDAEVRQLRDEFVAACGEAPIGGNIVTLPTRRRPAA